MTRRWQPGERAICSCPESCLVVSGEEAVPPTIERGRDVHACETACWDGDGDRPSGPWQPGDQAICSCPLSCIVVSGGKTAPPAVERGGKVHDCTTAVFDAGRPGRPRLPPAVPIARVSATVAAEMRRAIAKAGLTEREFLETSIAETSKRLECDCMKGAAAKNSSSIE